MVQVLVKTASAGVVLLVVGAAGGVYAAYRVCAEIGDRAWRMVPHG